MTIKTMTPREAATQASKAAATVETLERRLRDGDMTVTAAMLARAQDAAEHAQLVAEGAKAAAARNATAERERTGRELHAEWVAAATEKVGAAAARALDFATAIRALLDAVDDINTTREGFQRRHREVFAAEGEDRSEANLAFKSHQISAGEFGAIDASYTVARQDPVAMLVALVGEAVRGRQPGSLSGVDNHWRTQMMAAPVAEGLRGLRAIARHIDEGKETQE